MLNYAEKREYLTLTCEKYAKMRNVKIEFNKPVTVDGSEQTAPVHMTGLFPSGLIVSTNTVDQWIKENPSDDDKIAFRREYIRLCLLMHVSGDWGLVDCIEDFFTNEESLELGERLMSVYNIDGATIWIITEWDRSVTTVLFPIDY